MSIEEQEWMQENHEEELQFFREDMMVTQTRVVAMWVGEE
jgi:hypothetical protein